MLSAVCDQVTEYCSWMDSTCASYLGNILWNFSHETRYPGWHFANLSLQMLFQMGRLPLPSKSCPTMYSLVF